MLKSTSKNFSSYIQQIAYNCIGIIFYTIYIYVTSIGIMEIVVSCNSHFSIYDSA